MIQIEVVDNKQAKANDKIKIKFTGLTGNHITNKEITVQAKS